MPTQGKTPPPVPGENGASRTKNPCANPTGASVLAAFTAEMVADWRQSQMAARAEPSTADPDELPPGWNLPPLPHGSRNAQGQRKPAAKQQPQAQNAADSIRVCPKCWAVTRLPAAKCRECGHPFQAERRELQHVKKSQPPPPPGQGKHQQHAAGGAPPQEAQAQEQQASAAPFEAMGQSGDAFVYRTASGEVVTLPRSRHTSVCLVSLAPLGYWETLYPGKNGPNWLAAASSLFEQQRRLPPFSLDRIRGRGTWMDDGRTVLHLGDRLLVDGRQSSLDHPQSAYVYDRRPSLPELGAEPLADEAGLQVMQFLRSAGWRNGMDHLLLAGAIVLGPVGNALRLRPQLVVTAPRGAGKTEGVLKPAEALMGGPDMVLFAKGWTASAVRQSLSGDVLPVICDEWENAAKTPERRDQWGELLRVAYDGGECGRGTAHQQAIRQRVSSAFILAGINVEGMDDASRSRGVIVQKGILSQADIRQQVLAARGLAVPDLGRRLVRRTLANLPTLLQNTETIQQSLDGMDSRRADVYAHLLAGALLLVTTERLESAADAQSWLARIGWKADAAAEEDLQQDSEGRRCLDRLLRHTVRWDELGDRSREITISELIRKALTTSTNDTKADEVKTVLGRLGVKVAAGNPWAIYVAKRCSEAIYRGTTWADGNHLGRLLDLDGAKKDEAWFPVSRKQRCVWIPQEHVDETEPAPVSQQEVAA
jgi:putative DNA primase/helicase